MFVHSCIVCVCVCVCVCVVGRADKQAVGWEVEGVHRLRLLTQLWQNAAPGAPRNLAGGARRCNLIPSIQLTAPKNTQRQAARDTALSILKPLLVPFTSFCVTISFRGFLEYNLTFCQSLSLSLPPPVWHSVCLCLRQACSEMLRPCRGLKV